MRKTFLVRSAFRLDYGSPLSQVNIVHCNIILYIGLRHEIGSVERNRGMCKTEIAGAARVDENNKL